jgi:phosphoglycerate dehydrogenase-like enzyme
MPPAELLDVFDGHVVAGPDLAELIEADAAVVGMRHRWDDGLFGAHPRLRVVARIGIGIDNVDLAAASRHGVMVTNTPEGPTVSTAEHTITLVMAAAKRLPAMQRQARGEPAAGAGGRSGGTRLPALELDGLTLGLVGCGRIGRRVGSIATAVGMEVLACDPYCDTVDHELVLLPELLTRSHVVSLHAPLTTETTRLFDATTFSAMRPGAVFVNCARGGLVDHDALLAALDAGQVSAAGLDVTDPEPLPADHPLLHRDDVIVTPHVASGTGAGLERMFVMAVEQASMALRGERPTHLCNPDVWGATR